MPTLLVTGANGFIGSHLCAEALARGMIVRGAVRKMPAAGDSPRWVRGLTDSGLVAVGDIDGGTDWTGALTGVDMVVHLAGRAHVIHERHPDPEAAFRAVNVQGTRRLAEAMLSSGVRRLVFVSTIGVHGASTAGPPINESTPIRPHSAYANSKWEAEQVLGELAPQGLEVSVVRPALVYGPGVKGNLLRLLRLIDRGLPLPLGGIRNARSLLGVTNLCDLLLRCASDPRAAGETFVAADATPLSTPALVRTLARAMERPALLFWAPPRLLGVLLSLAGYGHSWQQLAGSLEVDAGKSRRFFDRGDPLPAAAGLAAMVRWY